MQNIEKFLEKYYTKDDAIILGCSTGPDSMFLLYQILETQYKKNLVVCYFNHKTRPETDDEEKFIEALGKEKWFQVEVAECDFEKIQKLYPSKSFEELAREKRYAFFDAIMNIYKSKYVITGHHLDDKVETFFFNLSRGSKLTGLINMTESSGSPSPVREGARGWGHVLRPLLNIQKSEILAYLDSNNLAYSIDSTNTDTEITRNYLRHEIIPKFEKVNKNYKENISKTLDYFQDLKNFIDEEVQKFLDLPSPLLVKEGNRTVLPLYNGSLGGVFVIEDFHKLSKFLQKEVIRYIYYISNSRSTLWLSEANIDEVLKFINGKNNKTIKEIRNMKLEKDNTIIIYKNLS